MEMVIKFDVVPMSLMKDGVVDKCPEFISALFKKEEGFRKGSLGNIPPGII
jgi:hypothetical protein